MTNTSIWDAVCKTDPEHTKGFKRAGGFSGTAIRPIWMVKRMTEEFGPVGIGWGTLEPQFQIVNGENKEVLVYCTAGIWHGSRENVVHGVGGDKVVSHIKANEQYNRPERWESDDEAFKKAYTDAMSNAMKFLGLGADVHMGRFEDSKYVEALKAENSKQSAAARNKAYAAVKDLLLASPEPVQVWNDHAPEIEEFTRQDAHFRDDLIGAVRRNPVFVDLLAKIESADDLDDLEAIKSVNAKVIGQYRAVSETLFHEIVATGQERKKQLNERKAQ